LTGVRSTQRLRPPILVPGDRIGIAAPSGPVRREALARGMAYLRERGYRPVPGRHLEARHGYLAGSDAERLEDLNRLLADRDLRAIWLARGGYGSARIVEGIDLRPLAARPKALVGYSDATVLHSAVFLGLGLPTFYGPNVSELGDPAAFDEASLWRCLAGQDPGALEYSLEGTKVVRPGSASGLLLGGCLSLLASLIGTPLQLPTPGAILFWEEVNEEPFRIDRMLGQLRQARCLSKIRGMVVGQTAGCRAKDPRNELPLAEIVERHLGGLGIPVVIGFPAGHGPGKMTLPLGRTARLDTETSRLSVSAR